MVSERASDRLDTKAFARLPGGPSQYLVVDRRRGVTSGELVLLGELPRFLHMVDRLPKTADQAVETALFAHLYQHRDWIPSPVETPAPQGGTDPVSFEDGREFLTRWLEHRESR